MRNGNLLKSCVSEICVKPVHINQGVGQLLFFATRYSKSALVSSCRCPKFHHELYAIEWTPTIRTSCNINHDGIWDTYKVQTPGRGGEGRH